MVKGRDLQNTASIAGVLLTTEAAIVEAKDQKKAIAGAGPGDDSVYQEPVVGNPLESLLVTGGQLSWRTPALELLDTFRESNTHRKSSK